MLESVPSMSKKELTRLEVMKRIDEKRLRQIVWKNLDARDELIIIHRPKCDYWVLPKGKRDRGESWQETVLCEVYEETACKVDLGDFIGSAAYSVQGIAKVVLFWNMVLGEASVFRSNTKVDAVRWVTVEGALKRLSYTNEKDIIGKSLANTTNIDLAQGVE